MKTRYYCQNKQGKDLFFVELLDEPLFQKMWLIFSFEAHFLLTEDMQRYIRCIEERLVMEPLRKEFLDKLFKLINAVPGIERLYFQDSVLDQNGKLMDSNYVIQEELLSDFFPEDYQVITAKDGIPFDYMAPYLYMKTQFTETNPVDSRVFSQLVNHNPQLQDAYSENVESSSEYYVEWFRKGDDEYGFYWMTANGEPVLYFIRKIGSRSAYGKIG